MTIARTLALCAALLAAASAATSLAGLGAAVPVALALLAAASAAVEAAFAGAARRGATRESDASAGVELSHAELPALAPASSPKEGGASPLGLEERLLAEREAEKEAACSMGASALRRLRFADSVLAKVPVETEEAAFTLMERLVALRDQSAKAAEAAQSADKQATDSDAVSALASGAHATIASVRSALSEMRKHDKDASSGLKALGEELKSAIELLAGIEEINERSKLIAINMAIEAARMGDKGRGFKVIVGELRALNERTGDFSTRVSELLGRFKKYNESLARTAIEGSSLVAEEVERGIGEEEKAIDSLLTASTSCVDLSDSVTQTVQAMNIELDGVLESLQFQDITRQMIEGALATIADAEGEIASMSLRDDSASAREEEKRLTEELRSQLLSRAKTKSEKEAIREAKR